MDILGVTQSASAQVLAGIDARAAARTDSFEEILGRAMSQNGEDTSQLRLAAQMFESYFLNMMFAQMRRTNFDENGLIPRSNAERIFTQMLDEAIADQAAERGGVGLADMLYRQMTRR